MADDISKSFLRFALRNSDLENAAHEPKNLENENVRNIAKLSISKNKDIANSGEILLRMMAESENNQSAKVLLEHKADIHKKRAKTNSLNASYDRKLKPSKEQLLDIRDEWIRIHTHEYGWKKLVKNQFEISYQTINLIMKEV